MNGPVSERRVVSAVAVLAALILASLLGVLLLQRYCWWSDGSVTVSYRGRFIGGSPVFRSTTGQLLVYLPKGDRDVPYLVSLGSRQVSVLESGVFIRFPMCALTLDASPMGVGIDSPEAETDAQLRFSRHQIAFNSIHGGQVLITLP